MLELIRGPRTRTCFVSAGATATVMMGLTVTVAGLVARFTTFDAARLKSTARRMALEEDRVGTMIRGCAGSKVMLMVSVVTAAPVVSTTFACCGLPLTITETLGGGWSRGML